MTPQDLDALDELQPEERARLDLFANIFEHLDASSYATLTEPFETDDVLAAKDRALGLIGSGRRREAIRAAVRAFVDAAAMAYSRRLALPDTLLLYQSLPDRGEDRHRFLGSVERAVVGLILWDELEDADRIALLGPWAYTIVPLIEPEG